MIQLVLSFALGFLCAGLVALLVGPALWRRAEFLTRRRIEASVPITHNELQAEKDRLRAEFALVVRRLEMDMKGLRRQLANKTVENGRQLQALGTAGDERQALAGRVEELEAATQALQGELNRRVEEISLLSGQLSEVKSDLDEKNAEIGRLNRMYEEASLSSSSRQIELVARESDIDRLSADLTALRVGSKDGERRVREIEAERKALEEALAAEKRRSGEMEKRLESLVATLADREEQLTRFTGEQDGQASASRRLIEDRERLESRLKLLTRENRKMRDEMKALQSESAEHDGGDSLLREQMQDIAAKMVHLVDALDGPDSPLGNILAAGTGKSDQRGLSLADRVRALQKAASER